MTDGPFGYTSALGFPPQTPERGRGQVGVRSEALLPKPASSPSLSCIPDFTSASASGGTQTTCPLAPALPWSLEPHSANGGNQDTESKQPC